MHVLGITHQQNLLSYLKGLKEAMRAMSKFGGGVGGGTWDGSMSGDEHDSGPGSHDTNTQHNILQDAYLRITSEIYWREQMLLDAEVRKNKFATDATEPGLQQKDSTPETVRSLARFPHMSQDD
jgi:hypothetical protein